MVHTYATAALKRLKDKTLQGDVEEESDLECLEADCTGSLILRRCGLSRSEAAREILTFEGHWTSPGEQMDLTFLAHNIVLE